MIKVPVTFAIKTKYPNAVLELGGNVALADQGDGPFIQYWGLPDPKPTQEQLNSWINDEEIKELYQSTVNRELNKPILDKLYDLDIKSIRALRAGDQARIDEIEQEAAQLRLQLLPMVR